MCLGSAQKFVLVLAVSFVLICFLAVSFVLTVVLAMFFVLTVVLAMSFVLIFVLAMSFVLIFVLAMSFVLMSTSAQKTRCFAHIFNLYFLLERVAEDLLPTEAKAHDRYEGSRSSHHTHLHSVAYAGSEGRALTCHIGYLRRVIDMLARAGWFSYRLVSTGEAERGFDFHAGLGA